MGPAAKRAKLRAGRRAIIRLGKTLGIQRERLVGSERQLAGVKLRHRGCFFRAKCAAIAPGAGDSAPPSTARSSRSAGRTSSGMPAADKQHLPRPATRGQDERLLGEP